MARIGNIYRIKHEICNQCLGCGRLTMPNGNWIHCPSCKGSGRFPVKQKVMVLACTACNGTGLMTDELAEDFVTCGYCQGTGKEVIDVAD